VKILQKIGMVTNPSDFDRAVSIIIDIFIHIKVLMTYQIGI